ncbi:MAG TPA: response regulator transcription factor [Pyrinomonadaceae bacterium]|nr:response regulator transcription factor [Pyrinomonadaceae bacterium]
MRVLIVEDERSLAEGLRFNFDAEGFDADVAPSGETGLEKLLSTKYDAIVLDVMLPGKSGFDVARELRDNGNYTPILMLTALGRPEDVLLGFEAGADDYLPKPFDLSILLARVNGLIRRNSWSKSSVATTPTTRKFDINGRTIDLDNLELKTASETIRLTLMETKLLEYLIQNEGKPVSRRSILEDVWGLQHDTDTRAIDNFIVRLRRFVEDSPNDPKIVETVRGVGYRLNRK